MEREELSTSRRGCREDEEEEALGVPHPKPTSLRLRLLKLPLLCTAVRSACAPRARRVATVRDMRLAGG